MKQTEETLQDQRRLTTFVPCGLPLVPCFQTHCARLAARDYSHQLYYSRVLNLTRKLCSLSYFYYLEEEEAYPLLYPLVTDDYPTDTFP